MKCFDYKRLLIALLALGWLGVSPPKAQAQFTVFDPTNFTMAGKIWSEDISTGMKMAQEIQLASQMLTQTMQIYSLAKNEASMLEKGQVLQAIGYAAMHASIPGHPEWDHALMTAGGLANAGLSWQSMTNPSMSLQSRISMINSFATSSLNSLGSCYAAAQQNGSALGGLQGLVMSMSGGANSGNSLRALGNMGQAQTLRYQQCQENLQEQRLKLELVRAQESLDRDQYTATTNATVDQYNSTGGGMWDVTPNNDLRLSGMH